MRLTRWSNRLASGIAVAGLLLLPVNQEAEASLPKDGQKDARMSKKIDEQINGELRRNQLKVAKRASDSEFLRRISLHLTGTIPPADEVVKFIKNRDSKKREKKIDEYIRHPMFAEHLSVKWANWMISRSGGDADRGNLEEYLRDSFLHSKPYDQLVRELLVSEGSSDENPQANYLIRHGASAAELAGHSARLFMGMQIQCAQCHNHPYEKWTQKDFWGYTAFFTGIRKGRSGMRGDRFRPYYIRENGGGSARYQVRGKPGSGKSKEMIFETATPRFLQRETKSSSMGSWMESLSKLLTSPRNTLFAKAFINRTWNHLMGRGLVMPIDDLGENNPPTHPELFELLADDFVDKGHDIKYVYRTIMNTQAYQRSSQPRNKKYEGGEYYAYYNMTPMEPEQLFSSLMQATGMDEKQRFNHPLKLKRWKNQYLSAYIFNFGNDEEEVVESFQGTIPQSLLMMNGNIVAQGIKAESGSNLERLFGMTKSDLGRLNAIFLASVSRFPTSSEKSMMVSYIRKKGKFPEKRKEAMEDIFWALINTTEFMFNH